MKLESIQDLSKLIDLCRKKGVESLELHGIKMQLSKDAPRKRKANSEQKEEPISAPQYTEEEILTWSSTPTN